MTESEAIKKINHYKSKINEINYKLDEINKVIDDYNKKSTAGNNLLKNKLNILIVSVIVSLFSLLSLYTLPISLVFFGFGIYNTIKVISYTKKLSKIKKCLKYLNSKKCKLILAKIIFEANQLKVADDLSDINKENLTTNVESVLNEVNNLQEKYNIDESYATNSL